MVSRVLSVIVGYEVLGQINSLLRPDVVEPQHVLRGRGGVA